MPITLLVGVGDKQPFHQNRPTLHDTNENQQLWIIPTSLLFFNLMDLVPIFVGTSVGISGTTLNPQTKGKSPQFLQRGPQQKLRRVTRRLLRAGVEFVLWRGSVGGGGEVGLKGGRLV